MGKTVRVRIAVAVDDSGDYVAMPAKHEEWLCLDDLSERHHVVYVEADVPIPEPVTVQGTVTGGGEEGRVAR